MEKPAAKPRIKLLKFLPRAASAISFHNLPFSPRRNKIKADHANANNKFKDSSIGNGFPGPILSIMPAEAEQKLKCSSFEAREPTSPKVSCMGTIKHGKKLAKNTLFLLPNYEINPYSSPLGSKLLEPSSVMKPVLFLAEAKKKQSTCVRNSAKPGRKSDASAYNCTLNVDRAPSLSQMKRFSSCRGDHLDHEWRCYSYDERGYSEEEEEEVHVVPFFAPILVGEGGVPLGVEPRKEINLWQRRTIAQPKPLEINTFIRSR